MQTTKKQASRADLEKQLTTLEKESESLGRRLLEIKKLRAEARAGLHEYTVLEAPDLNCECDANYCHTEKNNETISVGEVDAYCHDDQDRGTVSVHCLSGEIEVIISTAIWYTYEEYDRKTLRTGQTWVRNISSQSSWYDQTNRVEIVGKSNSTYNLDFSSWDD